MASFLTNFANAQEVKNTKEIGIHNRLANLERDNAQIREYIEQYKQENDIDDSQTSEDTNTTHDNKVQHSKRIAPRNGRYRKAIVRKSI